MTDMKAYLAAKYMTGPKADAILARVGDPTKKKKKRKKDASAQVSGGVGIRDDDGGWGAEDRDEGEDDPEAVVASDRSFKKRKTGEESGWATVREGIKEESPPPPEDEKPTVVADDTPFVGGLITPGQFASTMGQGSQSKTGKKRREEETAEERAAREAAQETVYRDVSGRKIDTKAERAEAARKKREREELEAKKMEWGKGLVQREDEEKKRARLEREKTRDLARYADDKELNEDLKAQDRWNDPAAAFLTKKKSKGPRRPEYTGPTPPPNRFGIKPGYRWDGVDRGNGFEKKLFQRMNERKRHGLESYQWSVDDM